MNNNINVNELITERDHLISFIKDNEKLSEIKYKEYKNRYKQYLQERHKEITFKEFLENVILAELNEEIDKINMMDEQIPDNDQNPRGEISIIDLYAALDLAQLHRQAINIFKRPIEDLEYIDLYDYYAENSKKIDINYEDPEQALIEKVKILLKLKMLYSEFSPIKRQNMDFDLGSYEEDEIYGSLIALKEFLIADNQYNQQEFREFIRFLDLNMV